MDLDHPLDADDGDRLAAFLAAREGAMHPETLDGYLCAMIIGTQRPEASAWMPQVLGPAALDWDDSADMERVLGLFLHKWNQVASGFRADWSKVGEERMREVMYLPDLDLADADADPACGVRWSQGFSRAYAGFPAALRRHIEADREAMATLALVAALDLGANDAGHRFEHEDRKSIVAHLVVGLQYLYGLCRRADFSRAPPVRAAPRPGRNDPCPCGSGRKFKKCCGEPSR